MPPAFVLKALYVLSSVPYRSRVILNLLCNNNCSEKKLFLKTSHFSGCVYLNVHGLSFASHHLRRWDHRARWSKVFLSNGEGRFEISFIFLACANLLRLLRLRNLTRMLKLGWVVAKDEQRPICHWAPNFSQLSCLWNSNGASLFVSATCQCSVQFLFSKFWLLYLYLYTCRHLYLYPPPVSALYSSCLPSSDSLPTAQDLTLDCCLPLEPISRPLSPAAHSILISLQWNASPPFRHLQHLHHQKLLTALLFLMGWEDVAWSWRGKKVVQEFEMVAN